jgi:SAM-dependent methyltransferase
MLTIPKGGLRRRARRKLRALRAAVHAYFDRRPAGCPVCDGPNRSFHLDGHRRWMQRCLRCHHEFVDAPPDDAAIAAFYDGFGYFRQDRGHQGISSLEQDAQWEGYLSARLEAIRRFGLLGPPSGRSVLEIGCLEGKLLQALSQRGFEVHGCDLNGPVVEAGRSAFGLDLRSGTIEQAGFLGGRFDIVLGFHVFEHLKDPKATPGQCRGMLNPGGVVLIEVPCRETDYDNEHHLHFFNESSVAWMFLDVFGNVQLGRNRFTTTHGEVTESTYALGRLDAA